MQSQITIPLNSSSLAKLNCDVRYANTIFRGLHQKANEFAKFGTAVHEFAQLVEKDNLPTLLPQILTKYPSIDKTQFVAAAMSHSEVNLGFKVRRELQFNEEFLTLVTPLGTILVFRLQGTIDLVSYANNYIYLTDYKTKRAADVNKCLAEYENGVQLNLYHYVIHKYGHKYLDSTYSLLTSTNKIFSRYCMVMLSAKPVKWVLGPEQHLDKYRMNIFEESLKETAQRIYDLYCLYEEHTIAAVQPNGWISNQCPDCEYSRLCHSNNDFDRNLARGEFDEYPYDPLNHRH